MPRLAANTAASLSAMIVAALLLGAAPASAQSWATKMLEKTDHDFGVVARGSDTVFKFEVKNIYKEDVVLGSVRSSCGCTTPSLENPEIATYEKGYVVAKFNTRTFTGLHSATLTVQVVKPYPAQFQLRVHGNIRGDVVFEPGSVDFGTVDQGAKSEKTLNVAHAGRSSWTVTDVRSVSEHLEAELVERERYSGRVTYDLVVRLRETAPPGFIKQQLVLVTNDASNPRIPIDVVGKVQPELTVAPDTLALGAVPQGEEVTKRVLVRGKKPFRVTGVSCDDECFTFDVEDEPAKRHMVTIRFAADREPGRLREPITITTDLGESYTATCLAYAEVTALPASSESDKAQTPAEPMSAEKTALAP